MNPPNEFETSPAALALLASLEAARPEIAIGLPEIATPAVSARPARAARIARAEIAPTLAGPVAERVPARIVVLSFLREERSFALASEIAKATGAVTIRAAREALHRLVNERVVVRLANLAGEEGTVVYRFALPGTDRNRFYGDPSFADASPVFVGEDVSRLPLDAE